jgi:hypothetical protein
MIEEAGAPLSKKRQKQAGFFDVKKRGYIVGIDRGQFPF